MIILIALIVGFIGGVLGAVCTEAYLNRRASNKIGQFEHVAPSTDRRAG